MNKKYLMFGLLGLFAISLVSAFAYYGFFSAIITVNSAISFTGCSDTLESVYAGETVIGEECTITNNAPSERIINIDENSDGDVDVSYMSKLVLAEKDTNTWFNNGETETIEYTVVGTDFIVNDIPGGMTLIYYPNTVGDDFATNVANIKVLTNGINENLPINSIDVGEDYCGNGFNTLATQCVGAKLWLIPGVLDETQARAKVLAWDTTGFYFETALIQYSIDGTGLIMSGTEEGAGASILTVTPVYKIGTYATGEYNITTTIA